MLSLDKEHGTKMLVILEAPPIAHAHPYTVVHKVGTVSLHEAQSVE